MNELLFFVFGLVIGGLVGVTFMCCLQINRINNYDKQIQSLKKQNKEEK